MDQTWARRDDLRPRNVSVWLWARAFWGLPAWLRRGKWATVGNVKFPTVFPLVKGKCFSVTGTRKCQKAGHSCMRRVVDCAGAPGAKGNVVIGRAGRAFLVGNAWWSSQKSHIQSRSLLPPMLHVTCLPPVWLPNGWIWTCVRLGGMFVWHQRTSIESGCINVWILTMVPLSCERNAHFWSGLEGHRSVLHCW